MAEDMVAEDTVAEDMEARHMARGVVVKVALAALAATPRLPH